MTSSPPRFVSRLIYVFTDLPEQPGTFAYAEVEAMAERGFAVEILCLRSRLGNGPGARDLRSRFPVHSSPYASANVLGASLRAFLRQPGTVLGIIFRSLRDTWRSPKILIKTLAILPKSCWFAEQIGPDRNGIRLHAFWASLPARAAWTISRLSGIPYSTWAHAGADIYNRRHQTEASLRTHLSEADLVLTCNRTNLPYFERILSKEAFARVVHHPHGVDLERFHPQRSHTDGSDRGHLELEASAPSAVSGDGIKLLSVGRLSPAKGFQHSIEACALLARRGVSFEYRIVGDGPLRDSLATSIRSAQLEGQVHLLGARDQNELPVLYGWADLLVAPSIIGPAGARDGLPNVVVEAMACDVPCVGSDAVGIPEAVHPGETGLLTPPGDPVGIANAIEQLASDKPLRRQMGTRASIWVRERFSRRVCMDRLAQILYDTDPTAPK